MQNQLILANIIELKGNRKFLIYAEIRRVFLFIIIILIKKYFLFLLKTFKTNKCCDADY